MPSDRVRTILPGDTATTWDVIAPLVPQQAYLGGRTAIAVHLGHRVSRDLDFFFHQHSIDLDDLASRLSAVGPFAVTERSPGTLNGLFSSTKVQFLHADEGRPQHLLEQPQETDGLRIAGLSDLIAMKLKVVGDRGELRDYFDLMTIEQRTGRTADEGLALFVARFQPEYPQQAINHILLGLGYFDDVDPDDALPIPRSDIVDYWTRRQREIIAARGRLPGLLADEIHDAKVKLPLRPADPREGGTRPGRLRHLRRRPHPPLSPCAARTARPPSRRPGSAPGRPARRKDADVIASPSASATPTAFPSPSATLSSSATSTALGLPTPQPPARDRSPPPRLRAPAWSAHRRQPICLTETAACVPKNQREKPPRSPQWTRTFSPTAPELGGRG
jgi:Nucleotidyl transferase AbiEii toxin, Type IV TA system